MHAAGDIGGAAAIAHGASKGMQLKQLAKRIKDTKSGQMHKMDWGRNKVALKWTAQKPRTFGYDPENRDPNLVRFIDWLLESRWKAAASS